MQNYYLSLTGKYSDKLIKHGSSNHYLVSILDIREIARPSEKFDLSE